MRASQRPTCTNVRVRSTRDANVLFHAVNCGILPMVTRRLDAADRAALRPGCVYVWEERSPASDATGTAMERFTEGRHWHPSRVRDDFLLYIEKDWETNESQAAERNCMLRRHRESYPSTSYPIQPTRRQPLVKQTYSAWVNNGSSLKKWHMNAYYTEDSLEELQTVDDMPVLVNLHVPHECYQRARSSTTGGSKNRERASREPFPGEVPRIRMPRRNSTASQSSQSSDRDRDAFHSLTPLSAHSRYAAYPPSPIAHTHGSSSSLSLALPRLSSRSSPTRSAEGYGNPGVAPPLYVPSQGYSSTSHRNPAQFPPSSPSPSASSSLLSSLPSPALDCMPAPLQISPAPAGPGLSPSIREMTASHVDCRLVPLERLAAQPILRREPADSEILRSFRPL